MKRIALAICIFALPGCTDLRAVGDISLRLKAASASWNDVGNEITASCERERTINPALSDCDLENKASSGLAGANAVLANYFRALGDAANESNFTIQPGLDSTTTSVANIPGINQDQVKAASGIFSLLAHLTTEKLRENTLRDLISHGAPPTQIVVRGLDDLVVPRLTRRLDTEKFQLTAQFSRWIGAQGDRVGPDPSSFCSGSGAAQFSGTGYLLVLEYCRRLGVIDARAKALLDYQTSLHQADQALAELQSSKTKLKSKALAQQLYKVGVDLDTKVAAVRKAFG